MLHILNFLPELAPFYHSMNLPLIFRSLCIALLTWVLVGCSDGGLEIKEPWIAEAPPNVLAQAGYMTIDNGSNGSSTLVGASSEAFESIEIHRSVHDASTGMVRMVPQEKVEIGPQQELRFEPGSYHLMLMKPNSILKEGSQVVMTLHFADGTEFKANFLVRREKFTL